MIDLKATVEAIIALIPLVNTTEGITVVYGSKNEQNLIECTATNVAFVLPFYKVSGIPTESGTEEIKLIVSIFFGRRVDLSELTEEQEPIIQLMREVSQNFRTAAKQNNIIYKCGAWTDNLIYNDDGKDENYSGILLEQEITILDNSSPCI